MEKKVKVGDLVRLTDPIFEGQIVKVEKVFGKFVEYNEGLTNCYEPICQTK